MVKLINYRLITALPVATYANSDVATRVGREKMRLTAFNGPSPKPPYRCKNLADISYTDRVIANFVPNSVAMVTGVGRGENAIGSIRLPIAENLLYAQKCRKKFLQKSSCSQFCPKFRCMTKGVSQRKLQLAAFVGPFPKNFLSVQKPRKNFLRRPSYS